jgi:hypothetical protein
LLIQCFCSNLIIGFLVSYATYALRDFYNVKGNIAALIGNISAIGGIIKLSLIFVGPINEIYGRRKPMMVG